MASTDDLKNLIQLIQQLKGKRSRDFVSAATFIFFISALGLVGLYFSTSLNEQMKIAHETLSVFFGILFSLTTLILLILGIQKGCRYLWRITWQSRNYSTVKPKIDDWNFQGLIGIDEQEGAIWLTDSEAGCFLRSCDWKNCQINFQAKCENDSGFGILFRVQDLEHYWMFKLNPGQNLSDHYRTERGWQILKQLPQVNFEVNKWYDYKLVIYGKKVKLEVNDYSVEYYLSDSVILNHPFFPLNISDIKSATNILTLPNNYGHGSVGFRACGGEKVYFRKLQVTRL